MCFLEMLQVWKQNWIRKFESTPHAAQQSHSWDGPHGNANSVQLQNLVSESLQLLEIVKT